MSRAEIDRIDLAILDLLAERDAAVAALWAEKDAAARPRHDPAREAELFARLRAAAAERGLDPDAIEAVFRRIVGRRLAGSDR